MAFSAATRRLAYYSSMDSHRRWPGAAFAIVLVVISFAPSLPVYLALALLASVLGGIVIGTRSAVYLASGILSTITVLAAFAAVFFFRVKPHAHPHPVAVVAVYLGIALAAGAAAALGVRISRDRRSAPVGSA